MFRCPSKFFTRFPKKRRVNSKFRMCRIPILTSDSSVLTSHNLAVLSRDAVRTCVESREKIAEITMFRCPLKVFTHFPDLTSHNLAVVSQDAVRTCVESGQKIAEFTAFRCPPKVFTHSPPC